MENSKGSALTIVLVAILIALVFGAGGYLLGSRPEKADDSVVAKPTTTTSPADKKSTDTSATDSTSAQSYSSTQYDFSLKYPDAWKVTENTDPKNGAIIAQFASPETQKIVAETPINTESEGPITADVDIYYYDSITSKELQTAPAKHTTLAELAADTNLYTGAAKATFAGQPAYEAVSIGMLDVYTILTEKDGHVYIIQAVKTPSKDKLTAEVKGILDSFQFTN